MRVHRIVAIMVALSGLVLATGIFPGQGVAAPSICAGSETTGAQCTVIIEAAAAPFPPPPTVLAMARITFMPDANFPDLAVPGPAVLVVETGELVVELSGETEEEGALEQIEDVLVRLAPVDGTPVPSTGAVIIAAVGIFRVTLREGDQLLIPADFPHRMLNDSPERATVLAVAVTPPEPATGGPIWPPAGAWPPELPDGVTVESLDAGYQAATTLPPTAGLEMIVERIELPAGQLISPTTENVGARLISVESGSVSLTATSDIEIRRADGTDERASDSTVVAAGERALAGTGVSLALQSDAQAGATLLVFSITLLAAAPHEVDQH